MNSISKSPRPSKKKTGRTTPAPSRSPKPRSPRSPRQKTPKKERKFSKGSDRSSEKSRRSKKKGDEKKGKVRLAVSESVYNHLFSTFNRIQTVKENYHPNTRKPEKKKATVAEETQNASS